jgi:hypothetical protein
VTDGTIEIVLTVPPGRGKRVFGLLALDAESMASEGGGALSAIVKTAGRRSIDFIVNCGQGSPGRTGHQAADRANHVRR